MKAETTTPPKSLKPGTRVQFNKKKATVLFELKDHVSIEFDGDSGNLMHVVLKSAVDIIKNGVPNWGE